jgi:hypothetical protein
MEMQAIRPFFHAITSGIQLIGLLVAVLGGMRLVRAPELAARRSTASADGGGVSIDAKREPGSLGNVSGERERYARGLTDFYRIQGGLAVLVGIILVLVPLFAS